MQQASLQQASYQQGISNIPQINFQQGNFQQDNFQQGNFQQGNFPQGNFQQDDSFQQEQDSIGFQDDYDDYERKKENRKSVDTTDQIYIAYENLKPEPVADPEQGQKTSDVQNYGYDDALYGNNAVYGNVEQFDYYNANYDEDVPNSPEKFRFRDKYINRENNEGKPVSRYANYRNQLK